MIKPLFGAGKTSARTDGTTDDGVPPPGVREVLVLQYLRGVAALGVVIFHVMLGANHYGGVAVRSTSSFGAAGVDLFFVISGFIMFYITAEKQPRPLQFLGARLLRVLPLYWLVTCAMFVMPLISRAIGWSSDLRPLHLLTSLLCIGGVPWQGGLGDFPIYRAGWTINYEIFFYLLFAGCLLLKPVGRSAVAVSVILGLLVLIGLTGLVPSGVAGFYTAPILIEFVFGIVIAQLYMRGRLMPSHLGWIGLLVGAAALYLLADAPARGFEKGLPAMLIVASALALEQAARRRPFAVLRQLGDASYSIYLTHLFTLPAAEIVFHRFLPHLTPLTTAIYMLVETLIAIAGGILCFHFVERPLHLWARNVRRAGARRAARQREALDPT